MIRKEEDNFILECDFCSNYIDGFTIFHKAVDYKRINNWKNINKDGKWLDKCPEC